MTLPMVEHIERQTKQKDAIRAALADCEEFISAQDPHRRLEDEGSKIGLATVYRQLNALADAGAADTIRKKSDNLIHLACAVSDWRFLLWLDLNDFIFCVLPLNSEIHKRLSCCYL